MRTGSSRLLGDGQRSPAWAPPSRGGCFVIAGLIMLACPLYTRGQDEPPPEISPPPTPCGPVGQEECDDENQCTTDACVDGYCQHTPLLDGSICDDYDPCTDADMCIDGECMAIPRDCDDENVCTSDRCDWVPEQPWFEVACFHDPIPGDCDDGDFCTEDDECNEFGSCSGTQIDCDDGNECTVDTCDPATGCVYTPVQDGTSCDDEDTCTVNDICLYGACIGQRFRVCDDGNPCTDDVCVGEGCQYPNNSASCNDGDACTENDTCSNGACIGTPVNCSDSDPCTINEQCEFGVGCVTEPKCNDGDACTNDTCDPSDGTCAHEPIRPPVGPPDSCGSQGCSVSMVTPAVMFVNNDDDNGNQNPDHLDVGPVAGENDLAVVTLGFAGCPPSECSGQEVGWELGPWGGHTNFYAYRNPDQTGPIPLPTQWDGVSEPWPPVTTAYLSGEHAHSVCGMPLQFRTVCHTHDCWEDSDPIVVVKVEQIEWREAAAGNPPIDDCPNNGGRRIFPGKIGPSDPLPQIRRKVKLVARVFPPIEGVTVYFKVWDVDDPFDQLHGINFPPGARRVHDVELIDNDLTGPDNRPTPEAVQAFSADTDANGEAIVTVTLSMQPGNNYRAAASCLQDAVNQASQATADALSTVYDPQSQTYSWNGAWFGYSVPAVWSPMLTVWRKLHIERDSMRAPLPTETQVVGTIDAITLNDPVAGQATIDLGQNLPDEFSDLNLYEEGRIVLGACPNGSNTFPVIESTSYAFADDEVIVLGLPGACGVGSAYTLFDDDDLSVLPRQPNGGQVLVTAFGEAYILPVYAPVTYMDIVDFTRHLSDWAVEYGGSWSDDRDLESTPEFWSCLVVGAWEPEQDDDADPDYCFNLIPPFTARPGAEAPTTGITDDDSGRAAIYTQALADVAGCTSSTDESHTVTHEVAHTSGSHPQHISNSIMGAGAPKTEDFFAAQSLLIFRNEEDW